MTSDSAHKNPAPRLYAAAPDSCSDTASGGARFFAPTDRLLWFKLMYSCPLWSLYLMPVDGNSVFAQQLDAAGSWVAKGRNPRSLVEVSFRVGNADLRFPNLYPLLNTLPVDLDS